jgi:hypothetical protein
MMNNLVRLQRALSVRSVFTVATGLAFVSGCVVSASDDDLDDDSTEQESRPSAGTIIKIQGDTDLALVLVREGVNGAWRKATRISGARYQASVRGPYSVLTVCETADGPSTGIVSQTLQDERLVEMDCVFEADSFPFVVSGTVVQPGQASLGVSARTSFAPNWTFHLAAEARTYDFLIAGGGRAVRRNLAVTGDVTLPPTDLLAQGTPLLDAQLTVTNARPEEVLEVSSRLINAAQDRLRLYRGPLPPKVAPVSMLLPGDAQSISVTADVDTITPTGSAFSYHSGGRNNYQPGQAVSLALWRPLAAVPQLSIDALGDDKVTWQASDLLGSEGFTHYVFDNVGHFFYHSITPSYLKATRISSMTVPSHVPGFKDEWRVDRSDYSRNFVTARENAVTHDRDGYGYAEYVYPQFSGPALTAQRAQRGGDARVEKLRARYSVEK